MAEDKRPDYRVNAEDPRTVNGNGGVKYVTVGAAWRTKAKDGREFISCVVNALPVGGEFTGRLTLWPTEKGDIPY